MKKHSNKFSQSHQSLSFLKTIKSKKRNETAIKKIPFSNNNNPGSGNRFKTKTRVNLTQPKKAIT